MPTNIHLGITGRAKLLEGINLLADAVGSTLGPEGKNVLIGKAGGVLPKPTKDGLKVTISITGHKDEVVDMGMQVVRDAAKEAYLRTGDGTTTATVLARALIVEGMKQIDAGRKQSGVIKGIRKAVAAVVENIAAQSMPITLNSEALRNIATISANNDPELGGHIVDCIRHVGVDGVTHADLSHNATTYTELKTGMKIDRGYIATEFITNQRTMECVLINPLVLIYDRKISALPDIQSILQHVLSAKKSLLIIAEDVDSEALATLITNTKRFVQNNVGINWAAIKCPNFSNRSAFLEDIAAFTGANVLTEKLGCLLKDTNISQLGSAEKIVISAGETTILGGAGNHETIKARLSLILEQSKDSQSEQMREVYQTRYASLSGSVAVLYIGRTSGMEISQTADRVDDAIKATKAALSEGIVAGGGTSLIRAIKPLSKAEYETADMIAGRLVVIKSLAAPLTQICKNAGIDSKKWYQRRKRGTLYLNDILDNVLNQNNQWGYNAKTGTFENLLQSGVIDPAKVVRVALEQAASVACMVLSTDCVISEI